MGVDGDKNLRSKHLITLYCTDVCQHFCKTVFACQYGAQVELFEEKKCRNSRDTVTFQERLNQFLYQKCAFALDTVRYGRTTIGICGSEAEQFIFRFYIMLATNIKSCSIC